jgi:hypothetical protein
VRLPNNTMVQVEKPHELGLATNEGNAIDDDSLFFSDQFVVGQHVVTKKANLRRGRWILGEYHPNVEPHGVVVDVRTRALTVEWVAQIYQGPGTPPVNFYDQPDPHLYPDDDLVVVLSSLSDATSHQIGDRVRFLDREIEISRYGAQRMDRRDLGGFDGNVWMVIGTNTIVNVDWQDGTVSEGLHAKDLRMYINVDEYEGWPVFPHNSLVYCRASMYLKSVQRMDRASGSSSQLCLTSELHAFDFLTKEFCYHKLRKAAFMISTRTLAFNTV